MENLKELKTEIIEHIKTYIDENGIENVDLCELGEAIDIVKDLSEAIYYCAVVKAMDEHPERIKEHLPA